MGHGRRSHRRFCAAQCPGADGGELLYVSILAAVTPAEVLRKLTAIEEANGFANRFLWV
jgi:hypothetical protein